MSSPLPMPTTAGRLVWRRLDWLKSRLCCCYWNTYKEIKSDNHRFK